MPLENYLLIATVVPLVMFTFLAFFGHKIGKPGASVPAILAILVSFACSLYVTIQWWGMDTQERLNASTQALRWHWATLGDIPIYFGVKLDSLGIAMFLMVSLIASCIFFFSRGYMAGHSDEVDGTVKYHRFFTYLCLFAFSMFGLIASSSLFFLFIFWELVGVCSYFLIGFYFDKKFASNAAMKAFITNRVGDFGFIIGLGTVALYLKDLSIDGSAANFAIQWSTQSGIFAASLNVFGWEISGMTIATVMGVALFCGCLGKSAQVPLQVWLPDAMAGPTPVSALIHAATMVAAGVYLVARIYPLLTPDALLVVAFIGCITLTMAALIAVVQVDIKKALAYSTLSQLGYMVFGLGVGAWTAALFHLITHAFFKAMMFLGSGQVIEGCHHVQDMRRMGGLRHKMPVTAYTFLLGVLAISGVGIMNTKIGLGGFYSKDEILAVAWFRAYATEDNFSHHGHDDHSTDDHAHGSDDNHHTAIESEIVMDEVKFASMAGPPTGHGSDDKQDDHSHGAHSQDGHHDHDHHDTGAHHGDHHALATTNLALSRLPAIPPWMLWLAIATAYITPFYMMRTWIMTFWGKPRDEHVYDHAHETPMMYLPLVVLAIGTVFSGVFLFRDLIVDASFGVLSYCQPLFSVPLDGHEEALHHWVHAPLTRAVYGGFIVGFVLAIAIYSRGLGIADRLVRLWPLSWIHVVLQRKFFFDELYNTVLVAGTVIIAKLSSFLDKWLLDFSIIENLARLVKGSSMISGRVLDANGIDKVAEGLGGTAFSIGDVFRSFQTGKVRNYVLFSATSAVIVGVMIILI